jgi:hypothetical protein
MVDPRAARWVVPWVDSRAVSKADPLDALRAVLRVVQWAACLAGPWVASWAASKAVQWAASWVASLVASLVVLWAALWVASWVGY